MLTRSTPKTVSEMKRTMINKMMAIAAFALAIGNAQARLGWTLDDCQSVRGSPVAVQYNAKIDQTCYTFVSSKKLAVQVYLLNGYVQSVNYCSRDAKFLVNNVRQLLQKNCSGVWNLYDDGRGRQTYATWNCYNTLNQQLKDGIDTFNTSVNNYNAELARVGTPVN
jgi:hypothetical protein